MRILPLTHIDNLTYDQFRNLMLTAVEQGACAGVIFGKLLLEYSEGPSLADVPRDRYFQFVQQAFSKASPEAVSEVLEACGLGMETRDPEGSPWTNSYFTPNPMRVLTRYNVEAAGVPLFRRIVRQCIMKLLRGTRNTQHVQLLLAEFSNGAGIGTDYIPVEDRFYFLNKLLKGVPTQALAEVLEELSYGDFIDLDKPLGGVEFVTQQKPQPIKVELMTAAIDQSIYDISEDLRKRIHRALCVPSMTVTRPDKIEVFEGSRGNGKARDLSVSDDFLAADDVQNLIRRLNDEVCKRVITGPGDGPKGSTRYTVAGSKLKKFAVNDVDFCAIKPRVGAGPCLVVQPIVKRAGLLTGDKIVTVCVTLRHPFDTRFLQQEGPAAEINCEIFADALVDYQADYWYELVKGGY